MGSEIPNAVLEVDADTVPELVDSTWLRLFGDAERCRAAHSHHSRVAPCKRPVGDAPLPMLSTEMCPELIWEKMSWFSPKPCEFLFCLIVEIEVF